MGSCSAGICKDLLSNGQGLVLVIVVGIHLVGFGGIR
jgi:hypothetical protein